MSVTMEKTKLGGLRFLLKQKSGKFNALLIECDKSRKNWTGRRVIVRRDKIVANKGAGIHKEKAEEIGLGLLHIMEGKRRE